MIILDPDTDRPEVDAFDTPMWDAMCALLREPYLVRDADGSVVRWNTALLDLFELTERQFLDLDPRDPRIGLVRPDGTELPPDLHPAMLVLHSGEAVHDLTLGVRGRNDSIHWVTVDSHPLSALDGSVRAVVTVYRRKARPTEEAQSVTSWRPREVFERSVVAMLVVDESGRVVDHNAAAAKLLRVNSSDLDGLDWAGFTGLRISDRLAQVLRPPIMQDMAPDVLEYGSADDGGVVPGLTQMSAIDWPGVDRATLVQIVDVTDLVAARREVTALNQQLNAVFEGSPIGMGLVSPDRSVIRSNATLTRLLGLTSQGDAVPGVLAVVHPDDREMVERFIDRAFAGRHLTFDHRLRTADGEVRWHRSQLSSVGTLESPLLLFQTVDYTAERESELMSRSIDRMTGMKSSEGITESLDHALGSTRRGDGAFALICVNIEGFRSINDRIGLRAADQLLQRLAISVQASLQRDASVGRVRGAVFLAIVPVDDIREARRMADSIERSITEERIPGTDEPVRCAIGALIVGPTNASSNDLIAGIEQLTALAATLPERRVIQMHTEEVGSGDVADPSEGGAEAIREAIFAEHVVAVGEPLFDLRGSSPARHFELFVRLVMPNGEHITYPRFEQHARRLDRIARIDELMIRRSLDLLETRRDLVLEVNVSPESMDDFAVRDVIEQVVPQCPVDPARLLLAVDQDVLMRPTHATLDFVDAVKASGCGLVIDNFGAVPGGERLFELFEPTRIKLDPGIIYPVDGRMNEVYLGNLVQTAHEHGVEIVAPFATNDAAVQLAAEHGLTFVQGRAVGQPINFG